MALKFISNAPPLCPGSLSMNYFTDFMRFKGVDMYEVLRTQAGTLYVER